MVEEAALAEKEGPGIYLHLGDLVCVFEIPPQMSSPIEDRRSFRQFYRNQRNEVRRILDVIRLPVRQPH
jgi:hypothetical protein